MMAVATMLVILSGCAEEFVAPEVPTGSSIVELADSEATFDVLTAALVKTGLANNLNSANGGFYTVFAPTDDAIVTYFKNLPSSTILPPNSPDVATLDEAGALDAISKLKSSYTGDAAPPSGKSYMTISFLANILAYHIFSSEVKAAAITGPKTFLTLQGTRLNISKSGSDVLLNANVSGASGPGAKVISTDVDASNGVIHGIDKVMVPFSTSGTGASAPAFLGLSINYTVNPPAISGGAESGYTNTNYNVLAYCIRKAALVTTLLPNTSPLPDFTIFAPTDAAFVSYFNVADEAAAIQAAKALTEADLAKIIKYHVVIGRLVSTDFANAQNVTTVNGATFTVNIDGSTITLTDKNSDSVNATITTANTWTNAGIIHTLDKVILPE